MRRRAAFAGLLPVILWAAAAGAEEADPCARALDVARQLRNAGQIHQALGSLGDCAVCAAAKEVCDATRISLRAAMPSIVVGVHDPEGRDRADAQILLDDAPAAEDCAVEVDPGEHHVRVEVGRRVVSERTVTLDEHDHERLEVIVPAPPASPPRTHPTRPAPASAWAFGASSLAAFAASGVLWAFGLGERTDALNTLSDPRYSAPYRIQLANARASDAQTLLFSGDAVSVVGVVSLVAAAVLYFARPTHTVTLGALSLSIVF